MSDTNLEGILFLSQDLTEDIVCASIECLMNRYEDLKLSTSKETICTEFSSSILNWYRSRPQQPCYLKLNGIKFAYANLRRVKSFHFVDKGRKQAMVFIWSSGDTFQTFIDDQELGYRFLDVFGTLASSIGAYFGFIDHEYNIYEVTDNFEVRGTNYVEKLLEKGRFSTFYLGEELIEDIGITDLKKWAGIAIDVEKGGVVFTKGIWPLVGGVDPFDEFYRENFLPAVFDRLRREYPQNK